MRTATCSSPRRVHHITAGRPDIAGAVMDAAAGLSRPPEMALLRTLRSGRTLSTEVVLALARRAVKSSDRGCEPRRARATRPPLHSSAVRWAPPIRWSFVGSAGTVTLADLGLSPG